ncbi:MAG: hypothetical protein M3Q23_13455 [Actinomycetota bacterium]|nr:hypothetical protein [Actinomycetota bacterium]
MADRRAVRAARWVLVATALIAAAGAALTGVAWGDLALGDALANAGAAAAGLVYAGLGVLIVRRAGNLIGWMLLGEGVSFAILCLASAYSVVGVVAHPGALPAPRLVGAIAEWDFVPCAAGVAFIFFVFPTGALPSRRWRPIVTLGVLASVVELVALVWTPRLVALPAPGGVSVKFPNPLGVEWFGRVLPTSLAGTINGVATLLAVLLVGAVVAVAGRYRAGGRELRQQIKWIAFAAAVLLVGQVVALLDNAACQCDLSPVLVVVYTVTALIVLFGIPAAIAIAITKYRLYDLDRIINRALVYGALTAVLAGVYVGLAVGIGSLAGKDNSLVIAGSTLVVAALFRPVRHRIQELIDRRFYRRKYDAQRTLEAFTARLREHVDLDELHAHLLQVVDETVRPASMSLWLREQAG